MFHCSGTYSLLSLAVFRSVSAWWKAAPRLDLSGKFVWESQMSRFTISNLWRECIDAKSMWHQDLIEAYRFTSNCPKAAIHNCNIVVLLSSCLMILRLHHFAAQLSSNLLTFAARSKLSNACRCPLDGWHVHLTSPSSSFRNRLRFRSCTTSPVLLLSPAAVAATTTATTTTTAATTSATTTTRLGYYYYYDHW